jgi:hypothetical protein
MKPPPPPRVLLALVTAILLGSIGSCVLPRTTTPTLLSDAPPAPPEIREACAIAETKCTRCHSLDRVLVARAESPHDWESRVDRMRLFPASGISPTEGSVIVRCLVFRSFGGARDPISTSE